MILETAECASPIGNLTVALLDGCVCALTFTDQWARRRTQLERRCGRVELRAAANAAAVLQPLHDYFAGAIDALASIPVAPAGTPFQQRVWAELRKIPAGRTIAYRDLAQAIGAPAAVRAVGAANGANPIALVFPCHRVIGSNGELTGYAGGIERKRWLLQHERAHAS